jgi:hypothetical protein
MTTAEFKDTVSGVFDAVASYRGCRIDEQEKEICRVQLWVAKLREGQWPKRLSDSERQRGLLAFKKANEAIGGCS